MHYRALLILIAGLLFCISTTGYVLVKIWLRPRQDSELNELYWEFEDRQPALKRYEFWNRIFFAGVVVSMLLMMIAISV